MALNLSAGHREVQRYKNLRAYWDLNDPDYRVYGVINTDSDSQADVGQIVYMKAEDRWDVFRFPDWPHSDARKERVNSFTAQDDREGVKRALMLLHDLTGLRVATADVPITDKRRIAEIALDEMVRKQHRWEWIEDLTPEQLKQLADLIADVLWRAKAKQKRRMPKTLGPPDPYTEEEILLVMPSQSRNYAALIRSRGLINRLATRWLVNRYG